ncbi:hypothetical protein MGU_09508 [Metarhizium guizhouense ARSEF 977]|uniref:BTB/POZ fold protein n=1 Tax=Metarhizium guizhouense (strain ARSEF 977) TaxID=1276136 RepID=A0A0B4GU39_METGA|nr:hypothetical protein MGU_09508 [Metarhizium guizhouense ARSEF 977]
MDGKVKWESVDEGTFICFWQYAYTGNYDEPTVADADAEERTTVLGNVKSPMDLKEEGVKEPDEPTEPAEPAEHEHESEPEPELAEPEPAASEPAEIGEEPETVAAEPVPAEPTSEPAVEVNDHWDDFMSTMEKKHKKKKRKSKFMEEPPLSKQEQLWAKLVALRRTSGSPEASHLSEDTEARAASETKVQLLCHAKVYVFADCYGVVPLMTLSFNKLHESLVNLNFHAESLAGFVALMQYCYETPVPDDLKNLVVLFAVCKVERLRNNKQFEDILEAHAQMGTDMFWAVLDRLE